MTRQATLHCSLVMCNNWYELVWASHSQLEPHPPHAEWQHSTTSAGISYFPTRWFVNNTSSSTTCFSDMKVISNPLHFHKLWAAIISVPHTQQKKLNLMPMHSVVTGNYHEVIKLTPAIFLVMAGIQNSWQHDSWLNVATKGPYHPYFFSSWGRV